MIELRLATPGKRIEQGLQPSPTAGIGQTPADLDDKTAVRERLERPRRPSRLALRSAAPARAVDGNGLTERTCWRPSSRTARVAWAEACVTSSPGCGLRCLPWSGRVRCDRPARRPHGPPPPPGPAIPVGLSKVCGAITSPPSSLAARCLPHRREAVDAARGGERIAL